LIGFGPRGALLDPLPDLKDLARRERLALPWHPQFASGDGTIEQAVIGFARNDSGPAGTAVPHLRHGYNRETAARDLIVMAGLASRRDELLDGGGCEAGNWKQQRNSADEPHV
jgi:hypothetical protein